MNDKERKLNIGRAVTTVIFTLAASPLLFSSAATAETARDVRVSQVGDFNNGQENERGYRPATSGMFSTEPKKEPDPAVLEAKEADTAYEKMAALSKNSNFNDLFGLNKEGLLKRFPALRFTHKADFSEVSWHGTDVSSVLELRFKKGKVSAVRLSTHYGYPRPGTTSDVEVGKWLTAPVKH
ncbi:hypothetical protein BH11CYA1_BH11CYA1_49660 [soil metagenome]